MALELKKQEKKTKTTKKQEETAPPDNTEAGEEETSEVKIPKELDKPIRDFQNAIIKTLDLKSAADVAMFGRMLADLPEKNIDGACQVAHPISTHAVTSSEFDYFTAMDDLQPAGTMGAGQIGTTEFNSACYYSYACIDTEQLKTNLNDNTELSQRATRAFVEAFVKAIPTGKQNSFSSPTRPSLVMTVVREYGQCSLIDAFEKPVRPSEQSSLVEASVAALDRHVKWMDELYGDFTEAKVFLFTKYPEKLKNLRGYSVTKREETKASEAKESGSEAVNDAPETGERKSDLTKLIENTLQATFGTKAAGEGETK